MLVTSIFSFSHNVFKRPLIQGRQKVKCCYCDDMYQSYFHRVEHVSKKEKMPDIPLIFLTCPLPNLPCISTMVMTVSRPRSICKYSYTSLSITFFGHHAPPLVSVRILKQCNGNNDGVLIILSYFNNPSLSVDFYHKL